MSIHAADEHPDIIIDETTRAITACVVTLVLFFPFLLFNYGID